MCTSNLAAARAAQQWLCRTPGSHILTISPSPAPFSVRRVRRWLGGNAVHSRHLHCCRCTHGSTAHDAIFRSVIAVLLQLATGEKKVSSVTDGRPGVYADGERGHFPQPHYQSTSSSSRPRKWGTIASAAFSNDETGRSKPLARNIERKCALPWSDSNCSLEADPYDLEGHIYILSGEARSPFPSSIASSPHTDTHT